MELINRKMKTLKNLYKMETHVAADHHSPDQTCRSNPVANACAHPKARPLHDPVSRFYCDLFHKDARSGHAAQFFTNCFSSVSKLWIL